MNNDAENDDFQPDRFVPNRPKMHVPLNTTPRTTRLSRHFGLIDGRVLNFKENETGPSSSSALKSSPMSGIMTLTSSPNVMGLLRHSAAALHRPAPLSKVSSVSAHLARTKQCLLTLDGPGIADDALAYPIAWSRRNLIAVACANDVYYQNLATKDVFLLCRVADRSLGELRVIEWAGNAGGGSAPGGDVGLSMTGGGMGGSRDHWLATGTTKGTVLLWDASRPNNKRPLLWSSPHSAADSNSSTSLDLLLDGGGTNPLDDSAHSVGALSWCGDVLAAGYYDGSVGLLDVRMRQRGARAYGHRGGGVLGVKWSVDGHWLASADRSGAVYVWDRRAGKTLMEVGTQGHRMRHRHRGAAAVKVCVCVYGFFLLSCFC